MKTQIFFNSATSEKLNEAFTKTFGGKVNLANYSREQLEDIRNKVRTRVFQYESSSGYNELLTNETYQKEKAILQLLNTRIKEMLDENLKILKDKLAQLDEAKKGVRAPKYTKKAKGTDQTGDGKSDFDDVQVARMTAGGVPKKQAIAKATSDKFKEGFGATGKDQKGGKEKATDEAIVKGKRYVGTDDDTPGDPTPGLKSTLSGSDLYRTSTEPGYRAAAAGLAGTGVKGTKVSPAENKMKLIRDAATYFLNNVLKIQGVDEQDIEIEIDDMMNNKTYMQKVMTAYKNREEMAMESSKKCNHTAEGKMCPVHGMKECGRMEEAAERKAKVPPSKGMTAKQKSAAVKQAKSGKDMGKPGKKFKDIAQAAGGGEKGEKIAGAAFWKGQAEKAQAKESQETFRQNVKIVNESLHRLIMEDEEGKAKAITAASDMVNDFTSWMQRVGQYQTKALIELHDAIRADFGHADAEKFKQTVSPALAATLETLTQQRETISNAVAVLAGEADAMVEPMGAEPGMGPPEPGMDAVEPDTMNAGDEFAASDAAAGGSAASGREVRESKFQRKLAESHSIISKLAK
jgi:hypothetical protein